MKPKMGAAAAKLKGGNTPESGSENSVVVEGEDEQLVYTWHKVNVFTTLTTSARGSGWFMKKTKESREKHILKDVTGVCRPGELLAIMGASGAGKTTLLNVLTHRNNDKLRITGDLFVNGRRIDPDTLTSRSAYVQQDDLFIGHITVREQLIFQAALRMDRHLSHSERLLQVNRVIMELGLTTCEHTRIGNPGQDRSLSGGEVKRLSFACEVLTNPSLLFCDEPTSGLDSFMAQNVVSMMKAMAERGKTVLSTIHQPSSEVFAMFDRILLLAEGRVAFMGSSDEALRFFGKMGMVCPAQYNPADYFISKLSVEPGWQDACRTHIHAVCDAFELGSGGRAMAQDVAANQRLQDHQDEDLEYSSHTSSGSPYRSSWGKQFHWVLWRSWLGTIREPRLIRIRFLQGLALSILLGFMYRRSGPYVDVYSINGSLFILIGNMTYQNMSLVVHTFCSQKELFLREHQNGMYRPDVYFISKNLVEAPVFTLYSIMYTTIFYLLAGYSLEWDRYLICVGTAVMLAWCAVSFGYFLSCVAPTLSIAVLLMAPSLILFSLLSGFYINLRSIPLIMKGFSHLSWYTYGNEILLVNQWTGVSNITCAPTAARCYPDGAAILEQLNFSEDGVVRDFASLGCLIVGYRLLAYLFFHLQTIRSKARR